MVNILDFISEKNRKDLSEHLHWCRGENKIDIENAAQQINCSVTQLDNWESGKEKIPLEPGCFPELPEEIAKICLK